MFGIIANQKHIEPIQRALTSQDIVFEKYGSFNAEEILIHCQSAARINMQTLLVDLSACEGADIIKGIRQFRFARNDTRIILLAVGRVPGDQLISTLVGLNIYDIVAPSEGEVTEKQELKDLITQQLSAQLTRRATYADVARWHNLNEEPASLPTRSAVSRERSIVHEEKEEQFRVLPNRTIVIGSLYGGSGSTFVTITIARMLNYLGIPNAIVECPLNTPELYSLLYGDMYAPKVNIGNEEVPYRFWSDEVIRLGRSAQGLAEWKNGETTWYPCNPLGTGYEQWSYELTYKLLLSIKSPIILYDVSHHWDHTSIDEICWDADEIIFVCDTYPSKLSTRKAKDNSQKLSEFKKAGKNVHLVANRDTQNMNRKLHTEWIHSLPILPCCMHPYIPYEDVIDAIWQGKLVQDDEKYVPLLMSAIYPMLTKLVPPSYPIAEKHKKNRFSWLRRR